MHLEILAFTLKAQTETAAENFVAHMNNSSHKYSIFHLNHNILSILALEKYVYDKGH